MQPQLTRTRLASSLHACLALAVVTALAGTTTDAQIVAKPSPVIAAPVQADDSMTGAVVLNTALNDEARKLLMTDPTFALDARSHAIMVINSSGYDYMLSGKLQIAMSDPIIVDPKLPNRYRIMANSAELLATSSVTPVADIQSKFSLDKSRVSLGWLNADSTLELDLFLTGSDGSALKNPVHLGGILNKSHLEMIGCQDRDDAGNDVCLFITADAVADEIHVHNPTGWPIQVICDGPTSEYNLIQSQSHMTVSTFTGSTEYSLTGRISLVIGTAAYGPCARIVDVKLVAMSMPASVADSDSQVVIDPIATTYTADLQQSMIQYDADTGNMNLELALLSKDGTMSSPMLVKLAGTLHAGRLTLVGNDGDASDAYTSLTINAMDSASSRPAKVQNVLDSTQIDSATVNTSAANN